MFNVQVDSEQVYDLVKQVLLDDLDYIVNDELKLAMQKVIAYYSVPGTYENGAYDCTEE